MISSRCEDLIRAAGDKRSVKLTDVRRRAKMAVEEAQLFGHTTFECWIHEDAPALPGDGDAWDKCMEQVRQCHIVVMLYNGNAGFTLDPEGVGICHAEMMTALESVPGKLRVIDLTKATVGSISGNKGVNRRFAEYFKSQDLAVRFAKDDEEALKLIRDVVQDAVIYLTDRGAKGVRKAGYAIGAPLDWSRYDYARRKQAIESVLIKALGGNSALQGVVREIRGAPVYFLCHAVPAPMSVAAAREMVGKPFLRDHDWLSQLKGNVAGPVHVIGCHKAITENQAVTLLGFPDATVVTPEFGIYVADPVQKIQLVFLANCRDETTTRVAVERFQSWLAKSGEAKYLAQRAQGRKAIASTIAAQLRGKSLESR
jgi:hypothetical protein